ncbi:hypothetical protein CONPUDRAFT_137599 [Coniophora puteana RWD-64-598 SS2]|uniref:Uncharacterized protein n=1 Tax=Coniophora puteana (strain RWD-64-598) TaxID=741705 RepID=A0A5M3MNZ6_CONPW|nr:uncharacterized protein CONPUDRAFT_137599 [Coniophora puteana RWD-64-598 SS2]EIW80361.1 hypothetical protein CONPUDRAFT_137599 [Coniophora puteana RWD-64-598 SS2]
MRVIMSPDPSRRGTLDYDYDAPSTGPAMGIFSPQKRRTQKQQDMIDKRAYQNSMENLVSSWQERLQLISVITTFFASMEAAMLVVTDPANDLENGEVSNLLKAANAGLLGALVMHVYAAVLSFLAAFLLIRYKLREASKFERKVEGAKVVKSPIPTGDLKFKLKGGDVEAQKYEKTLPAQNGHASQNGNAPHTPSTKRTGSILQNAHETAQTTIGITKANGTAASPPTPTTTGNGNGMARSDSDPGPDLRRGPSTGGSSSTEPIEPPLFSRDPHLEQVGPFWLRGAPSQHLLSRIHLLCIVLASAGFVLALMGILAYGWARQPREVSVFVTAILGAGILALMAVFVPDVGIEPRQTGGTGQSERDGEDVWYD